MARKNTNQRRYCICRRTDSNGSMVACDRCDEWYHFKCIGIKEEPEGDYFCDKCKKEAKQCANPECVLEVRRASKYCSDECGIKFNKFRYHKFFRPKWERLAQNHSSARTAKMDELERLEVEKEELYSLIGRLKDEKEELDQTIKIIKDQAKQLSSENRPNKGQDESESELDDEEETVSSDQTKTFCVICGVEQPAEKAFKHWTMCHKKQEATFNFTSDLPLRYECPTDKDPKLYCQKEDKKTKRFCLNIESACPQHSNWQSDPSEICGCPLKVMQKLKADGNYCPKLKSNCMLHYNWDRFRLASKNMERILAFQRLEAIEAKIRKVQASLNDTYGGVLGVMLHNTIDGPTDQEMIEI